MTEGSTRSKQSRPVPLADDGRLYCQCSPPVEPKYFRVRKEGANKGRGFFTCANRVPNTDTGCTLFVWEDDAKTAAAERGVELKYPKLANKTAPSYSNRPRGAVEANTLAPAPVHKTQPPTNYEFEDNEEAPVGGRQSGAKEALRSIKKARVNYSDESTDDELYMEQGNAIDWEAAEKTVAAVEASQPTSSTKEGPPKANFVNPFIKDVESISDRSQVNPTSSTLPIPNSNNYRSSTPPRSPQFSSHYAQYGYALPHSDDVRPNVAKTGFLPNGLITPQTTPQKPTNKRHLDTSPHTEGAIVIDEVSSQDASLSIHPHLTSLNAHLHRMDRQITAFSKSKDSISRRNEVLIKDNESLQREVGVLRQSVERLTNERNLGLMRRTR